MVRAVIRALLCTALADLRYAIECQLFSVRLVLWRKVDLPCPDCRGISYSITPSGISHKAFPTSYKLYIINGSLGKLMRVKKLRIANGLKLKPGSCSMSTYLSRPFWQGVALSPSLRRCVVSGCR
jgi:hypothetical protein